MIRWLQSASQQNSQTCGKHNPTSRLLLPPRSYPNTGRVVPPLSPVDIITDDESYQEHEVNEVLDSRYVRRKLRYYIAWKGGNPAVTLST